MNVTAPADPNNLTLKGRVQGDVWRLALERPDLLTPSNGGEVPVAVNWWFGPKDRTMLATAPDHLSQAVNFGMFSIIARHPDAYLLYPRRLLAPVPEELQVHGADEEAPAHDEEAPRKA